MYSSPQKLRPGLGVLALLLAPTACSDYALRRETPRLEVGAEALEFGQVVRGTRATLTFNARNAGQAPLTLHSLALVAGSSEELGVGTPGPITLAPGDAAPLEVSYTPEASGWDYGELDLQSDDPDQPLLRLAVSGQGVEPALDVDPETLWFGEVSPGSSASRVVDLMARGDGRLRIEALELPSSGLFSLSLPESVTLPGLFAPGEGFAVEVTFTPADDTPVEDELLIRSSDPEDPLVAVRLLGNSAASGDEGPTAEITTPNWGAYLLLGEPAVLEGVVVDDADPPPNLLVAWYAGSTLLGVSTPDTSGRVQIETSAIPEGAQTLRLRAVDTGGLSGEDEVDVVVWDPSKPLRYVLSGGNTTFDWWTVDDDVTVMVDGVVVFQDTNHTQDNHQPVELEARPGQTLRIVANDVNACALYLSALTLHWGAAHSQPLTDTQCRSACAEDVCFDGSYGGPWPTTFLDESVVIAIP